MDSPTSPDTDTSAPNRRPLNVVPSSRTKLAIFVIVAQVETENLHHPKISERCVCGVGGEEEGESFCLARQMSDEPRSPREEHAARGGRR